MLPFLPGMLGSARKAASSATSTPALNPCPSMPAAGGRSDQHPLKVRGSRNGARTGASCTRAVPKMRPSTDRKKRSGNTTRFCIRDQVGMSFSLKRHLRDSLPLNPALIH
jgi:hypothetical protein